MEPGKCNHCGECCRQDYEQGTMIVGLSDIALT